MSKRETILEAILAQLKTIENVHADRNLTDAEDLDANPSIISLYDGGLRNRVPVPGGDDEFVWAAEVDIAVAQASEADRNTEFDRLVSAIVDVISVDHTLGGLVDFVEAEPTTDTADERSLGAANVKRASVPIVFYYTAATTAG